MSADFIPDFIKEIVFWASSSTEILSPSAWVFNRFQFCRTEHFLLPSRFTTYIRFFGGKERFGGNQTKKKTTPLSLLQKGVAKHQPLRLGVWDCIETWAAKTPQFVAPAIHSRRQSSSICRSRTSGRWILATHVSLPGRKPSPYFLVMCRGNLPNISVNRYNWFKSVS